jgi:putative transposase
MGSMSFQANLARWRSRDRNRRYTEEQIIGAINENEAGAKVDDICRKLSVSCGTFYNWRSKYAELEVTQAKRLCERQSESDKLKRLLADKLLEVEAMKTSCQKSGNACRPKGSRPALS